MMKATRHRSANLSLLMLTALVAGNMIGSGIFTLPATLASFGSISLLAWLVTAAGAMLLAFTFAQWSRLLPKTGGPYAYCREAFGNFIGFEVAYSYWIAIWVGNAAVAVAFSSYLAIFFPIIEQNAWVGLSIKLGIIWLISGINLLGIKGAAIFQLVATVLKIIPLILIGAVGIFFIHPEYFQHFNITTQSNSLTLNAAATLTFWAFVGLESATIPAADVDNKKTMAYATLLGTGLTAIIYILCSTAVMGLIPPGTLIHSSAPFADAMQFLYPAYGTLASKFIAICAAITCIGTLNGWTLLQAQVPKAVADDGLFPPMFSHENKHGVPFWGIIISSLFISLLLLLTMSDNLLSQFNFIILIALFFSLLPYSLTALGAFFYIHRYKAELGKAQYVVIKVVSLLAALFGVWAIIGIGWEILPFSILVLFCGIPFYTKYIAKRIVNRP